MVSTQARGPSESRVLVNSHPARTPGGRCQAPVGTAWFIWLVILGSIAKGQGQASGKRTKPVQRGIHEQVSTVGEWGSPQRGNDRKHIERPPSCPIPGRGSLGTCSPAPIHPWLRAPPWLFRLPPQAGQVCPRSQRKQQGRVAGVGLGSLGSVQIWWVPTGHGQGTQSIVSLPKQLRSAAAFKDHLISPLITRLGETKFREGRRHTNLNSRLTAMVKP